MLSNDGADDIHRLMVGKHKDLWVYIIEKYKNEASTSIVGLGDLVVSPLIELSQWDYHITYVSNTYMKKLGAEKFFDRQAGMIERTYSFDFLNDVPTANIITFIGIAEYLDDRSLFRWLDLLTRRCSEIIFAVPCDRDWNRLLSSRYDTLINKYISGDYYLISISRKYDKPKVTGRTMEEGRENSKTKSKTKVLSKEQRKDNRGTKKLKPKIANA